MQNKYNIGMVLDGFYPSDIRVRKEAESLAAVCNVFVLCVKKETDPIFETINGVHVIRKISYKSLVHEGIIDALTSIRFIHPLFSKHLEDFVINNDIKTLHVHDLPLAKTVYQTAKKLKIHSLIDLHENYPEALKTWFLWRKSWVIKFKNSLFFRYSKWVNYEKKILPKYDTIIAVVAEMKTRLLDRHALDPAKIIVISNTEKKEFAQNFKGEHPEIFNPYLDRYIIAYVGGIGPHRGLQTAVRAIKRIKKELPNVLLAIIGPAHPDVFAYLKQLVKEEGVKNEVQFFGNQSFKSIPKIMQSADINIIPHERNEHTDSTIPHKLFQILMSEKPLLVSDCKPLQRVVKTNEVGWVFEAGNPVDFADKVIELTKNTSLANQRVHKGKRMCIEGDLNWEHTAKTLLDYYTNL